MPKVTEPGRESRNLVLESEFSSSLRFEPLLLTVPSVLRLALFTYLRISGIVLFWHAQNCLILLDSGVVLHLRERHVKLFNPAPAAESGLISSLSRFKTLPIAPPALHMCHLP